MLIDVGPGTPSYPQCNYPLGTQYDGEVAKPEVDSPCHLDYADVDLPHGTGVLTQPDGIRIEGAFVDGRANGEVHWTDTNTGWNYMGEFLNGTMHGQVVASCPPRALSVPPRAPAPAALTCAWFLPPGRPQKRRGRHICRHV